MKAVDFISKETNIPVGIVARVLAQSSNDFFSPDNIAQMLVNGKRLKGRARKQIADQVGITPGEGCHWRRGG